MTETCCPSLRKMGEKLRSRSEQITALNHEVENIFALFKNDATTMRLIAKAIRKQILKNYLCALFQLLVLTTISFLFIYYISFINSHLSAISRIILIKLLPIWDWQQLTDENCLIGPIFARPSTIDAAIDEPIYNLYEEDCALCENYGKKFTKKSHKTCM